MLYDYDINVIIYKLKYGAMKHYYTSTPKLGVDEMNLWEVLDSLDLDKLDEISKK